MDLTNRFNAKTYCGIGISIKETEQGYSIGLVDSFIPTPAQKSGIENGDRLLRIQTPRGLVTPSSNEDFNNNLRGPQGSTVTLEIQRKHADAPELLTLTRDVIIVRERHTWQGAIPYPIYDHPHRCQMNLSALPTPAQSAHSSQTRG